MHTYWNLHYPACHSSAWWVWWEALQISRSNSSIVWYPELKGKDIVGNFPSSASHAHQLDCAHASGHVFSLSCLWSKPKSDCERREGRKDAAGAEVVGIKRGRREMLGVCRGFCCSDLGMKTINLMLALEVLKPSGSEPKHPKLGLCCLINPEMNNTQLF